MFRIALVVWIMLGTALAGTAQLAVLIVPELSAQAMKNIPLAVLTGFAVSMPLSYLVARKSAGRRLDDPARAGGIDEPAIAAARSDRTGLIKVKASLPKRALLLGGKERSRPIGFGAMFLDVGLRMLLEFAPCRGIRHPPFPTTLAPNEDRRANLLFRHEERHPDQGQEGNRVSNSRGCN